MSKNNPPFDGGAAILLAVAEQLRPHLEEMVFVGGQVSALMITQKASESVRSTFDVDVVVPVTSKSGYAALEASLRDLGLRNDARDGAPICRWLTPDNIAVDVMPAEYDILGFANRWYPQVLEEALKHELQPGLWIRIPPAPLYIATKWEAYDDRGAEDPLASHDLEDIIAVVAGRPEIVAEIASSHDELREWLAERTAKFLKTELAEYAIAGALNDARIIPDIMAHVLERFRQIAESGDGIQHPG